jgi:hypothetical protein
MALVLTATQQVTYSVSYVDGKGNPAPVEGAPVWEVSDTAILSVEAAPDGMSALVKAVGPVTAPGASVQLSVKVDAELDEGVTEIVGLDQITVVAGQAVSANITAGAPEEQPVVTP